MKLYQKLNRFPLGSVKPQGFLRDQLVRNKNGMGGHLDELEPDMIANPFVHKTYVQKWGDGDQSGWGAEISGNYWTGTIELAFTLGDEELIAKVTKWVDAVLKNQRADGYLGTYYESDAKIYEDYNAWGTACGMCGLLAFYDATGREDVLEAVYRCMLWFCDVWGGDKKTTYAGPYIIEPMIICYRHTGDKRLLEFCEDYQKYLCEHDLFNASYLSLLNRELEYNSNHTAGFGVQIRLPALISSVTGNSEYLKASENAIEKIRKKANHITGSPVSVNEYLAPVCSTAETEYCSYRFYNQTYSYMSNITGEAKYGDYMEELFYNGAQGARKKDEKAIAYLSAPNQIYATSGSSSAYGDMQIYAPCYPTSCCPVNSVALLPEFVSGMMLRDNRDNIYMTAYGPCSLEYGDTVICENTLYPFRDTVTFTISANKEFSIFLKIPSWSRGETVTINGKEISVIKEGSGYAEVRKVWASGDILEISFQSEVEVLKIDDSDAGKKYPIAIRYGALVFSLPIEEEWHPCHGKGSVPEGWSWYEVYPVIKDADVYDFHEMLGLRRYQTQWNIALSEHLKAEDVIVEKIEETDYAWEYPLIKLHLKGFRAPYLCAPYPQRTFEPFGDKQIVDMEKDITLVPYGCTNLRITYFPRADLNSL